MNNEAREQLIISAASKVHEAWCEGELRAFYNRFAEALKSGESARTALDNACLKNGKQRNFYDLDAGWLIGHEIFATTAFESFEGFKLLVEIGIIVVKRFTTRNLTEEEQKKAGKANYDEQTKGENILRPFEELSADSQKENLEAARGAVYVYEEYAKRGVALDDFSSEKAQRAVGTLIHADWMERNERTESNKDLFVAYTELDDWTKQQDLDVFNALVGEVKKDEAKYAVEKEEGIMSINPIARENAVLDAKVPGRANGKEA